MITVWQHISPEVIVNGFKKCCIFSAMDGTDNDMLWHDGEVKCQYGRQTH